jgi:hypothetical protein
MDNLKAVLAAGGMSFEGLPKDAAVEISAIAVH